MDSEGANIKQHMKLPEGIDESTLRQDPAIWKLHRHERFADPKDKSSNKVENNGQSTSTEPIQNTVANMFAVDEAMKSVNDGWICSTVLSHYRRAPKEMIEKSTQTDVYEENNKK